MKLKAKLGAYSSIVGQSVHLIHEDGRMAGQVIVLAHLDELRDRETLAALLVCIRDAINAKDAAR